MREKNEWAKKKSGKSSNRPPAALLLGACSILSACAADPVDSVTEDAALVITNMTPTLIEGTFADSTAPLSFQSIERAPRSVDVTIRVGETELAMRINWALGEATFDAKSGQLSPAQITALKRTMAAFVEEFGNEDTAPTNAEVALRRSLGFILEAPTSTNLPTFSAVAENSWSHLPCGCGWRTVGAYSLRTGRGETCGGSIAPHCPGRCGIGCGPDNLAFPWSWGSGVYTRDCALHDYVLGSFEAAMDDYVFAPKNCL